MVETETHKGISLVSEFSSSGSIAPGMFWSTRANISFSTGEKLMPSLKLDFLTVNSVQHLDKPTRSFSVLVSINSVVPYL